MTDRNTRSAGFTVVEIFLLLFWPSLDSLCGLTAASIESGGSETLHLETSSRAGDIYHSDSLDSV